MNETGNKSAKKRSRRWLLPVIVFAFLGGTVFMLGQQGRPLFEVAKHLRSIDPLWNGVYEWMPDGRELCLEEDGRVGCVRVFFEDKQTGKQTLLPRLTRLLQAKGSGFQWRVYPSPDGKRILAVGNCFVVPIRWVSVVCDLEPAGNGEWSETVRVQDTGPNDAEAQWMPDGRRIVTMCTGQAPRLATVCQADKNHLAANPIQVPARADSLLGITPTSAMITAGPYGHGPDTRHLDIYVSPVDSRETATRHYVIDLPAGRSISEFRVSPAGDRIAWILERESWIPSFRTLLAWCRDRSTPLSRTFDSVWVSEIDGTGMRELGEYVIGERMYISNIRWMPDGRISFASEDGVWTVRDD